MLLLMSPPPSRPPQGWDPKRNVGSLPRAIDAAGTLVQPLNLVEKRLCRRAQLSLSLSLLFSREPPEAARASISQAFGEFAPPWR